MRVAIVHDDLVQWGGAERVLLGICEIFPDAPIYTSVRDYNNFLLWQKFVKKTIVTSFLQKIPGWKFMYKALLPLYPIAFEQFNFDRYDLVISNTTRFAKSIITKPQTIHICYCHTPPRFLWRLSGEKNYSVVEYLMSKLRAYDQVAARRVDYFLAGSENAKRRITKVYGLDSKVVYPFVNLNRFKDAETFDGGYFVVIARQTSYKKIDLAIKACEKLSVELKIIDGTFTDELVTRILAGCRALIISGIEDFGLASLEAQALGKGVVAFRAGGALETVVDGKTGIFFDNQSVESLTSAIKRFNVNYWNKEEIKNNAKRFSKEKFISNFRQTVSTLVN